MTAREVSLVQQTSENKPSRVDCKAALKPLIPMLIPLKSSDSFLPLLAAPKVTAISSQVSPWFSHLAYPLGRYLVLPSYFGQIEVTGREHLPTSGPIILAPTHRSRWDAFMVPYAAGRDIIGRELRFMVSADEMKGLQGWIVQQFGGFPVNTRHPSISCLRHGVDLLCNGEALVIFPEGGIYRDNHPHQLKPGLARLALQAETSHPGLGIKVVPIKIDYSDPYPHWGSQVKIRISQPLLVSDYLQIPTKQSAQQMLIDLAAVFQE
jgi:1-acyl-sn-glycerol-3-phosphate acyltransferase